MQKRIAGSLGVASSIIVVSLMLGGGAVGTYYLYIEQHEKPIEKVTQTIQPVQTKEKLEFKVDTNKDSYGMSEPMTIFGQNTDPSKQVELTLLYSGTVIAKDVVTPNPDGSFMKTYPSVPMNAQPGILTIVATQGSSSAKAQFMVEKVTQVTQSEQIKEDTTTQPTEIRNSYLGLWKAEKMFGFDQSSQQWKEGTINPPIYMEFKEGGLTCGGDIREEGFKCSRQDTYTVDGDIINVVQPGVSGPPWHYKWKIIDGKLELASEIFLNNSWLPFIKHVLTPIPYPPVN